MVTAVESVVKEEGAVGVLVNNAGYSLTGAVESLSMDDVRRQFETNVFGLVRMCQLVLPGMREQHWGRILNVASIGGRLVFPGMGAYHGTKYAVEAFSDALRFEVAPFGVKVSLIEPGIIKTAFNDTAHGTLDDSDARDGGIYDEFHASVAKSLESAYSGAMGMLATGPETVANVMVKAAGSARPKTRYPITLGGRGALLLRSALPDAGWDLAMRTSFTPPKAPTS
jgi:NAD(P)-dependent dehydrogenase (short-subunit alcohol dehydrogenase family)